MGCSMIWCFLQFMVSPRVNNSKYSKGEVAHWQHEDYGVFWAGDVEWGEHGFYGEEPFEPFGNYLKWLSKSKFLK